MVEGCEQSTALRTHLVPIAASLLVNSHANPDGGLNRTHLVSRALRGPTRPGRAELAVAVLIRGHLSPMSGLMTGEAVFQRNWEPPMVAMAAPRLPAFTSPSLFLSRSITGVTVWPVAVAASLGGLTDLVTRLAGSFPGAGAIGEGQGTKGGSSDRGTTDGSDRAHLAHETCCLRKLDTAFPHELLMFRSTNADPEWESESFRRRS